MIEVTNLTKRFGTQYAVNDVSFRCDPGTVTGFLGPNGAGKSTTMRAIVGLTIPTSGTTAIDGRPYSALGNPARRVGVLLDASAQHVGRSGREALTLTALTIGAPKSRVEELLDLVQLRGDAAKKRVGQYSLGMRQRLGIAQALLGDPGILILDEPANGLDPEGIHWMRGLLRDFAERGGTVLLSSHLLSEVEAIADRFVILGGGRLQMQGTKAELLGGGTKTLVRAADTGALDRALAGAGFATTVASGAITVQASPQIVGDLAAQHGLALRELREVGADLERVFLELTAQAQATAPPPGPTFSTTKQVSA